MVVQSVKWDRGAKADFLGWMYREISNTLSQRAPLESRWVNNLVQWRAEVVGDGVSDVPFIGASDLPMPLTAIHNDPVLADMIQTLHIPQNFWSVGATNPIGERFAKPTQEFLSRVEKRFLRMRQVNTRVLMDTGIHGTGIYKDHFQSKLMKRPSFGGDGERAVLVPKIETSPLIQHVPLEDFITPPQATDIDPDSPNYPAQWVAHRYRMRAGRLRHMAKEQQPALPGWDPKGIKAVLGWATEDYDSQAVRSEQQAQDSFIPFNNREITLYEIWLRYDVDDDGVEEDVVVTWHQETREVLRTMHNPYQHGKRPFSVARHMPGLGFYGIGMAEMNEWSQLASERILNATINSATLANSNMFSFPLGSKVLEDEPIYPGRIFQHAPGERPHSIQMGSTSPAMFQLLTMFMQFSEQRTGVNELRQGNVTNLPDRVPAAATNAALAEGSKRFDMILGNLRDGALKDIGERLLQNLSQMSKDDPKWKAWAVSALGERDGGIVSELLDMPADEIPDFLGVNVTATSSQNNKAQERQQLSILAQTLAQAYPQMIQYAQIVAEHTQDPTPLAATVTAAYTGTVSMTRKLLEAHDEQDPDSFVPQLQAAEQPGPQFGEPGGGAGEVQNNGASANGTDGGAGAVSPEQAILQSANVDLIQLLGGGAGGI